MTLAVGPRPHVGRATPRREDERFLTGRATYVDDLPVRGAAHVVFVRSPHAHARLGGVAVEEARAAPGVLAVLTGADLAGRVADAPARSFPDTTTAAVPHPVLARDRVRYVGEAVAAVVACRREDALDAAELVAVDYEPLDAVVDPRLAAAGPALHEHVADNVVLRHTRGDPEGAARAIAGAARVVTGSFHLPRVAAVPIEPRGALARHDRRADVLAVWASAQDPHRPLADLSHLLGRDPERLRVVCPDVGGAFGSKGAAPLEAAVAAVAAMDLGRPVKWVETRSENLLAAHQGRGLDAEVELALDEGGRMLAVRARLIADLGAYLLPSTPLPPRTAASLMTGPYAIPVAHVEVVGVATTKVPTGPYRGAGRPEAAFLLERMVDQAAAEAGLDPVDLRRANLLPPGAFPHATPLGLTYDSGNYAAALDRLEAVGAYRDRRAAQARARAAGRLVGLGVGLYIERAGGGSETATLAVEDDGGVLARTGSSPHGQGHETTFSQIVADRLGVDPSAVALAWGDSAADPGGTGTFGSRSLTMGGSAMALAAEALAAKVVALGSHLLGVDADRLVVADGRVGLPGGDGPSLSLAALARAGRDPARLPVGMTPGLQASECFTAPFVFAAGAYLAAVEVDPETGRLIVADIVAVDDVGRVVNPLLAEGQVLGGSAQGLGQVVGEEVVHDEAGQVLTGSLADYGIPTAADVAPVHAEFVETPSPLNPLGAKGVGEGGAIGVPAAVANAVADALAPLGIRHVDPPYTPEVLWRLVAGAGGGAR